jgi:hypothetical protein
MQYDIVERSGKVGMDLTLWLVRLFLYSQRISSNEYSDS